MSSRLYTIMTDARDSCETDPGDQGFAIVARGFQEGSHG